MPDVEIVIKMPEERYNQIKENKYDLFGGYIFTTIRNGILLPKGHGRLGDLDALEKEMENGIRAGLLEESYDNYPHINNVDDCVECVKYADTIVEADKEKTKEEASLKGKRERKERE